VRRLEEVRERYATERFEIGRGGNTYMTRYTLLGQRAAGAGYAVYLHHFHRGDWDDALHDHPWSFVSVILSGGYYEQTERHTRWYGPGRMLVRPAEWRHRTILPPGREAWTLILRGRKRRSWFFWCLDRIGRLTGVSVPWRSFIDRIDSGSLGCGSQA
jgi:hypothetical protein